MSTLFSANAIMEVARQTGQEWKECRKKQYTCYWCGYPSNYVFANKFYQTGAYRAFKKSGKLHQLMTEESFLAAISDGQMDYFRQHNVSKTVEGQPVLCGTRGELSNITVEQLYNNFTEPDGSPVNVNKIKDNRWHAVKSKPSKEIVGYGIMIPAHIDGLLQGTGYTVNAPVVEGHGNGDVIIVAAVNGQPDFSRAIVVNNEEFALTYDLSAKGWLIFNGKPNVDNVKPFTLEDCVREYDYRKRLMASRDLSRQRRQAMFADARANAAANGHKRVNGFDIAEQEAAYHAKADAERARVEQRRMAMNF